jgi:hypothetical protein
MAGIPAAFSYGRVAARPAGVTWRHGHTALMNTSRLLAFGLAVCTLGATAEELKLPIDSDDKGIVYVAPDVVSTQNTVVTQGATVGVQRPDGSTTYGGMNVAGERPMYSVGASTGGDVSFSAGVQSDGRKESAGVKAGVTIKY